MNSLTIPLKVEAIDKIKVNKSEEQKKKIKRKLRYYINTALERNTLKGFDAFVETFSGKARYRKIKKEYLIDLICELVGELMEEKARQNSVKLPTEKPTAG